jgi:uncharacterized phage protein gp47/JayE
MAFTVPTLDELVEFLIALAKGLFPDLDTSRTSFPAIFTKVLAAAAHGNHAHLEGVRQDLTPLTATGDALAAWGTVAGVPRKQATVARKAAALRVTNTDVADHDVTIGDELVHSSGLRFAINRTQTVTAESTADVDVISIDTGSACRLAAGEFLTFVSPPAGLEERAELQIAISEGGDDLESEEAWSARIVARFQTPPLGGAAADYVAWSTALEGVTAAYCYPTRQGLGTVDVAALHSGSGADRLLNPSERADLLAVLEVKRPVGVTVRVLEVLQQQPNVEVTVADDGTPATAWDWVDQVPLEVLGWVGATRTLQFTVNRPDTMVAAGRIVIADVAGDGDGRPYVIESLSGLDSIVLEEQPKGFDGADLDPLVTDIVYSGGALTALVREALLAHINGLGTANPGSVYGSWEGDLRLSAIYRVATGVTGVRDATPIAPASNVAGTDPAFPADDTIYLITPGRVLVRRAW